jgi:multidrug efflux system outer membrane protein
MRYNLSFIAGVGMLLLSSCAPKLNTVQHQSPTLPQEFKATTDTTNSAKLNWKSYFNDPYLNALIDTALANNQELNIMIQEVEMERFEIGARKGEYLPSLGIRAGAGMEKPGAFTRDGAVEEHLTIKDDKRFPEPLGDFMIGAYASWELDVWSKLRNAKRSAMMRYMASKEGQHFLTTQLIAEIADNYYELIALDNQLQIVHQNIELQSSALNVVKQQKEAAKVTQLAVNRFEAQLLNTINLQYEIQQAISEKENRINYLVGRYPQRLERTSTSFDNITLGQGSAGIPSQLLQQRPDIRQAENLLQASKLDVAGARASFYPQVSITAGIGTQAFNPAYIVDPKSLLYNLAGDIMAPLINRSGIKAAYYKANANQIQSLYKYEQTVLNAYIDVLNQVNKLSNYSKSYETKKQEVDLLVHAVNIANGLFNSARADYGEVLLTQHEALESKMELIEIKLKQLSGQVNLYRALGGGWTN